jgi:hypothetical protein
MVLDPLEVGGGIEVFADGACAEDVPGVVGGVLDFADWLRTDRVSLWLSLFSFESLRRFFVEDEADDTASEDSFEFLLRSLLVL